MAVPEVNARPEHVSVAVNGRGFDVHHTLRRRTLSALLKAICLPALFVFYPLQSNAATSVSNVIFRPHTPVARRNDLTNKLRMISGWRDLNFDEGGALRLGEELPSGGSETARRLLAAAVSGNNMVVLEDASNRRDVVFCSVIEGRWTKDLDNRPPVYVILIDFADFSHVMGDRAALEAFNVGWGVMHEIDHVVTDSVDPTREGHAGECENAINQMRRECGLAERAEYFFNYLPGTTNTEFVTRYVRIAFERRKSDARKKRYWLIWDAALVGGLEEQKEIAAWR